MFYITFHGSKGHNNIFTYSDEGEKLSKHGILPKGGEVKLRGLRGFAFRNNKLYVANSNKDKSALLVYDHDPQRKPHGKQVVLATPESVNGILHPFALDFDQEGNIYVSSQDTNVVTGLSPSGDHLDVAASLLSHAPPDVFLQGTCVASCQGKLPLLKAPHPPDVPSPHGLHVGMNEEGMVQNSVRGVVIDGTTLYVANEPGHTVNAYQIPSGDLLGQITREKMQKPVHLVKHQNTLYIGAGDHIYSYDLSQGPPSGKVKPKVFIDKHLNHTSGITFDGEGNCYAALRTKKRIRKFTATGEYVGNFIDDLPDDPEFILWKEG